MISYAILHHKSLCKASLPPQLSSRLCSASLTSCGVVGMHRTLYPMGWWPHRVSDEESRPTQPGGGKGDALEVSRRDLADVVAADVCLGGGTLGESLDHVSRIQRRDDLSSSWRRLAGGGRCALEVSRRVAPPINRGLLNAALL
jgi:hypothetical protein